MDVTLGLPLHTVHGRMYTVGVWEEGAVNTQCTIRKTNPKWSHTTIQKENEQQVQANVTVSPNLRSGRVAKVTHVARLLPIRVPLKIVRIWTWCTHERNVCPFSNVTSHWNCLLLSAKHLAIRVLMRKNRIVYDDRTDGNSVSDAVCDTCLPSDKAADIKAVHMSSSPSAATTECGCQNLVLPLVSLEQSTCNS